MCVCLYWYMSVDGFVRAVCLFAGFFTCPMYIMWSCIFSVLELDSRYKWRVMPPNTHRNLFPIGHFYAYSVLRCTTWKLQVVCKCSVYWTTAILSETFFVCIIITLEIRLESYGPRHASVVLRYHIVCVYILQARIYIAIWYRTTLDNKTHAPYDCILQTKQRLDCQRCIVL